MSDPTQLSDAELAAQIAQLQAQSSTAATGTSPPASSVQVAALPPVAGAPVAPDYDTHVQGLSDAQLQAEIARLSPMDALQSFAVTGLGKGAASVLGFPGDVASAAKTGENWVLQHLGVPTPAPGAFTGMAAGHLPTSSEVNSGIQAIDGPYYQPQTAWGRGAETVGEMLPAALLPGSLAAKASRVLVPAAASDAAGEGARMFAPGNAGAEGIARAAGGVVGGGLQGIGEGIVNAPQAALAKAMSGADPARMNALADLLRSSQALPGGGITLTPAEAGAQVGIPQLAKIQHFVENTPQGGAQLAPFFAQRPGQVASTTNTLADALDGGAPSNPGLLGMDAQRAAQGAQRVANSARSDLSGGAYAAAGPEAVDGQGLAAILSNIDDQVAGDKTGLLGGRLAQFRNTLTDPEGLAHVDIDNLARVRNYWRDQIDIPPVGADPLSKEQAGAIGGHLSDLESLMAGNANYARGQALYADASRNIVDPTNAGPIGTIAGTDDVPTQLGALFQPRNVGGSAETAEALSHLWGQDPSLPGQLTGQYLRNTADGALKNLQGGENEWGGARLGVRLGGSPEARSAFLGGTDAAGGDANQMADYLDALGATGKRLPVGSRTYFNEQMANELGLPDLHKFTTWTDPLTYGNYINNAVGGALYKHRIGTLADFLTSGDAPAQIKFLDQAQAARGANFGMANALLSARAGADAR